MKTLIIAGTSSGTGKTTISLGLMAAFRDRGLTVAPFKVGPDYIDPLFHRRVCNRPSRNLDGWLMGKEAVCSSFLRGAEGSDLAVVEGVMGLFDGYDARSDAGSTAEIAKWLGAPVVLVVDAHAMSKSAAALVRGFESFDRDLSPVGVIFNRVGSRRHMGWLSNAVSDHCRARFLGGLFRDPELILPERHLGLVTDRAVGMDTAWIRSLSGKIREGIDLDALYELAGSVDISGTGGDRGLRCVEGAPVRIGVAMDPAFCFYYEDNLELLRGMGAELVPFSPLYDDRLPGDLDGLYLGGGYPEMHAERLSRNRGILDGIRERSEAGLPVYAECGGMMLLSRGIYDLSGNFFPLASVFPFATGMLPGRQALGYVTVRITEENLLGPAGGGLKGHEFHYSRIVDREGGFHCTTRLSKRTGEVEKSEGFMVRNTFGSYVHLHFGAFPGVAEHLVGVIRRYKEKSLSPRRTRGVTGVADWGSGLNI